MDVHPGLMIFVPMIMAIFGKIRLPVIELVSNKIGLRNRKKSLLFLDGPSNGSTTIQSYTIGSAIHKI